MDLEAFHISVYKGGSAQKPVMGTFLLIQSMSKSDGLADSH